MRRRWKLTIAGLVALFIVGPALGYTYTILREDIGKLMFPSYQTIIPTDSPLRNSMPQSACNEGFSPNPCGNQVHSIPEPGIIVLFGIGLGALIIVKRKK